MSFDKIFDLTAGVYFDCNNIVRYVGMAPEYLRTFKYLTGSTVCDGLSQGKNSGNIPCWYKPHSDDSSVTAPACCWFMGWLGGNICVALRPQGGKTVENVAISTT